MTDSRPLVSAVVTTHNRPGLLKRALDSVVAQTYPNLELIVVDDGSAESSEAIVDPYGDQIPVRFIRNETPKGACKARNQGIENAAGEFVAGLDDDDEWHPDRIEKLAGEYSDDVSFVTSDVWMVIKNGRAVWKKKKMITLNDLLYSNKVGNQGLIKKEYLKKIGGFDESLSAAQDYDLWIRLCEEFGPVKNVPKPLQTVYMDHSFERISNPKDQLRGYLRFYQKHKSKMNRSQRKYQLYNIRKATGKNTGLKEILSWVPPHRLWKEIKYNIGKIWMPG
ncbi:MAG: glycosyltransferase [Balneolaceae bacterium]